MAVKLNVYGDTDIGRVRTTNQDRWIALPEVGFFAVADGIGGHRGGDVAADTAIETLIDFIKSNMSSTPEEAMRILAQGIALTNREVYQKGASDPELSGMGSTLCCLQFVGDQVVHAHVGDSRIYLKRSGQLRQLTEDHSLVEALYMAREISREEAENFKGSNKITKAIGPRRSVEPTIHSIAVQERDLFLLCTDGLSDPVSFPALEAILNSCNGCQRLVQRLIRAAHDAGGDDNITALLVECESI